MANRARQSCSVKDCWRSGSFLLVVTCHIILLHSTNAKVMSQDINSKDFTGSNSVLGLLDKLQPERAKRAAESDFEKDVLNEASVKNIVVVVSIAAAFCLSSITLVMCIFCNACEDDKSSDAGVTNGYIGEINLADIQVIYNPSAGAPQLPYTHQNQGFRGSQEDIILANPAVLQAGSNNRQNLPSNQNPRLIPAEGRQLKESRRHKDVYLEMGYPHGLEYANPYTQNQLHSLNNTKTKNYTENGKENVPPVATHSGAIVHTNRSRELYSQKDYDMNNVTIKNMHVRY